MRRRGVWILAGLLLLAAAGAGVVWALWPTPAPPPAWAADYDLTARPPDAIAPGTVIERSAPPGWSHLVIKSLPRVKPGEEAKVPVNPFIGRAGTVKLASWLFTAFVADVVPERRGGETRYRLRAVGLGLGTAVGGRDVVITPETAERFGADLTLITREILTTGYRVQREARVVVLGPSFGLVDTPVWFRCGGKNRLVRFRYALLVDTTTGRLDVLAWSLGAEGGGCADPAVVWLKPDTIDEAELVVDPAEFNAAGVPSEAAFAVEGLPPGRARLLLPEDLRPLAAQTRFTADEARALERRLRQLTP